jgi:hypothetical protein
MSLLRHIQLATVSFDCLMCFFLLVCGLNVVCLLVLCCFPDSKRSSRGCLRLWRFVWMDRIQRALKTFLEFFCLFQILRKCFFLPVAPVAVAPMAPVYGLFILVFGWFV